MSMATEMTTVDEYLIKLQVQVDELNARVASQAFENVATQQDKILLSFLSRANQISVGCLLVGRARLGTPLFVLTRVLCEDLFLIAWISLSESNAAVYANTVVWELARIGLLNIEKGRAKIVSKTTGADCTATMVPKIKDLKTDRNNVEQLAGELGLGKVYDILYRSMSPEVHGKTFGMASSSEDNGLAAALSAVISLIQTICLIADNKVIHNRTTTADEVLRILRIDTLGGS